jgi:hypothetical protein
MTSETVLSGMGSPDLLAAMDDNHAAHAVYGPGITVRDTGDLILGDSGLADDTFNIVARARFTLDDAERRIASTVADLRVTGRPYSWWVGPTSTPPDLSDRLSAAGLPVTERETAMAAPMRDVPEPETGLTIRIGAIGDFARVVAANWDPPAATVIEFFARRSPDPESPSKLLVGYADGRPVAGAEVFLAAGVAGFYSVCTLLAHRRRGYAAAMTAFGMRLAATEGYDTGVLQASGQGRAVYERLGFRDVGGYVEHSVR